MLLLTNSSQMDFYWYKSLIYVMILVSKMIYLLILPNRIVWYLNLNYISCHVPDYIWTTNY